MLSGCLDILTSSQQLNRLQCLTGIMIKGGIVFADGFIYMEMRRQRVKPEWSEKRDSPSLVMGSFTWK